jgi:acyl-coenzyme A synthetase/AMP-(fatty) acid ligase
VPKSIKYTTQAGGKMNNILIKNLLTIYKKHNIKLIQMYGATEATSRMSYLNYKFAQKKIGSIGQAIPGGKFEIRNKDGKIINTVRKKGELIYRGKNVFMGYATCISDLALSDINKGILYTGDIAYKDKDDFYYIIGRKDRYVKIYGIRVNLSELENILYKKGIDANMKELKDNKIEVYFKKLNNIDNIISYLCKKTNLKKNVFITKKLTKKNFNKNLKIKI